MGTQFKKVEKLFGVWGQFLPPLHIKWRNELGWIYVWAHFNYILCKYKDIMKVKFEEGCTFFRGQIVMGRPNKATVQIIVGRGE